VIGFFAFLYIFVFLISGLVLGGLSYLISQSIDVSSKNYPFFSLRCFGKWEDGCQKRPKYLFLVFIVIMGSFFLFSMFGPLRVATVDVIGFIMLSFSMILALVFIDLKYMAVPDQVNFAALFFAIVSNKDMLSAFIDALIVGGGLYVLGFIISKVKGQNVMGSADAIFAAVMAALFGIGGAIMSVFIGSIIAIPVMLMLKNKKLPFIPFLAMGTMIFFFGGEWITIHLASLYDIPYEQVASILLK